MDHAHALLAHLREDNPAPAWCDPQEGWLSYGELARRVARLAASYPDERNLVYLPFSPAPPTCCTIWPRSSWGMP